MLNKKGRLFVLCTAVRPAHKTVLKHRNFSKFYVLTNDCDLIVGGEGVLLISGKLETAVQFHRFLWGVSHKHQ